MSKKSIAAKKALPGYKRVYKSDPEGVPFRKEAFYKALEANLGLVTRAREVTGMGGMAHYRWLKEDPVYRERCEKLIELKRDLVEHKLTELVEGGEPHCITFASRCLLRPRGYDQSSEIRNVSDEDIDLPLDSSLVDGALANLYKEADNDQD